MILVTGIHQLPILAPHFNSLRASSPSLIAFSTSVFFPSSTSLPAASYSYLPPTRKTYQQSLQIRQTSLKSLSRIRNHLLRLRNNFLLHRTSTTDLVEKSRLETYLLAYSPLILTSINKLLSPLFLCSHVRDT